ncbi:MAG: S1/P1 nuclease [Lentisphaerae bacterium]|nr:S1/P1 nuclease [Lentisphaerota bacterium]
MQAKAIRWSVLVGFCLAARALAWGPEGHEVVGEIAERFLTPDAHQVVDQLLDGGALGDDKVANWPDYMRGVREWETPYPRNDQWHYIDIDLDADRLPPGEQNIVRAIQHFTGVIKTSTDKKVRREALCFLVHFVGDVHQPLHCAHRNNDRGGNLQIIKAFEGQVYSITYGRTPEDALNLHGVWDFCLVKEAQSNQTEHAFAFQLGSEITRKERARWARGGAEEWAWESHLLAKDKAYTWKDGEPMPLNGDIVLTSGNYIADRSAIVRLQLQKAGIRLAALLNEALVP